jgi:hypothetical protein
VHAESQAAFDGSGRQAQLRGDLGVGELAVEGEGDDVPLGVGVLVEQRL